MKYRVLLIIAVALFISLPSCKKAATKAVSKTGKEVSEEVVEKAGRKVAKELLEEGVEKTGKKFVFKKASKEAAKKVLKGDDAIKYLSKCHPDVAKLISKMEKHLGDPKYANHAFNKNNYSVALLEDGSTRLTAIGSESSSIVMKGNSIICESGGFVSKNGSPLNQFLNYPLPNKKYKVNGCIEYRTDKFGRVVNASADRTKLYKSSKKINAQRDSYTQRQVVESLGGKRGVDDGGHLFSNSVNGPNNLINQVPMNSQIQRSGGAWREFEKMEEEAIKAGKNVVSERKLLYKGDSKRPYAIEAKCVIDGKVVKKLIEI